MQDRWTFQDDTKPNAGCCRILLDGMDVCIDVFPFRKDADPEVVKAVSKAVVEVLNAAEYWREGNGEAGCDRLEVAVDMVKSLTQSFA